MCLENLAMSLWSSKHIKPLVNFSWKRVQVIVCSNSATTTVVTKLMNDRLYWFPNKSFQRQSLVFCKCYLWFFCGKILQNLEWLLVATMRVSKTQISKTQTTDLEKKTKGLMLTSEDCSIRKVSMISTRHNSKRTELSQILKHHQLNFNRTSCTVHLGNRVDVGCFVE